MKSNNNFYEITPTIFNIVSMLFFSPHTLYWWMISHQIYLWHLILYIWTSYQFYCIQQPIHCVCTITASVPLSHPHFQWYHTLCIYDIAPNICLSSDTLYKVSHAQFMTSRHIIYDIRGVVFMSSLPRYLTLHPEFLSALNHSKYDLWMTVCMTSHPLYIWHLMHHR